MEYAVGNLAQHTNTYVFVRIYQITSDKSAMVENVNDTFDYTYIDDTDLLTPIPLTTDMLVKLGFKIHTVELVNLKILLSTTFILDVKSNEKIILRYLEFEKMIYFQTAKIQYLHQLQNIANFVYNHQFDTNLLISSLDNSNQTTH